MGNRAATTCWGSMPQGSVSAARLMYSVGGDDQLRSYHKVKRDGTQRLLGTFQVFHLSQTWIQRATDRVALFSFRSETFGLVLSETVVSDEYTAEMSLTWVDVVSILGTLGTFGFGYVALMQRSEIASMKVAVRVHAQSTYNAWWYVAVQAEKLLQGQAASELQRRAAEIHGISHVTRSQIIAFGREYAGEPPSYEPAWEPRVDRK